MLIPYVPTTVSKKAIQLFLKHESESDRSCSLPTFWRDLRHDTHAYQPRGPSLLYSTSSFNINVSVCVDAYVVGEAAENVDHYSQAIGKLLTNDNT